MATPASLRVLEWNMVAFRRLWRTSILSSFLQPLLYLLAMGVGVGALVNRNTGSTSVLQGLTYAAFIAPGLLATTTMMVGTNDSMWPIVDALNWGRQFEAMAATPIEARSIATAHVWWIAFRAGLSGATVALAMEFFPQLRSWGLLGAIPASILGGVAFGMPIAAWSITRTRDMSFPVIQRFIITPLFLFGGAFFPVSQLPVVVRWVAYVSPLWHAVELCRAWSTSLTLSLSATLLHVGYLLLWAVVGWVCMAVFARRRLSA